MKNQERVCLGAVVGVHGIKGEVKVKSFTANEKDIERYGELENKDGSKKFSLKITGHSKELLRAKVKGVEDRNVAETLIGTGLYVNRNLLPELEEEEFYHSDLIGLDVKLSETDEVIGEVAAIYNFGAGDLLDIKMKDGTQSEMIPFTKQYVPVINIKDGYIIIEMVQYEAGEDGSADES